ncbi:chromosome-associated kinesin KIF4 [Diabrotica virgifera virgifera]|uniref:Kinesin motor domain-containing protein n=1 Tax=Diabrotica virgifera virgifera TaxID=50390 RepID=A0ABM5KLS9_DIAVI|nr:chromosome-associated kinesin KIF4 [Diabrotica virgifera virgifera]XP_050511154.1 chromosome-associated kinesin KIF4 [Diabrotica virgifera virgifera]
MSDNTSVRVAVRVRPLVPTELSRGCKEIVDVIKENEQILIKNIDKDKAYTFNYVLGTLSKQGELYERCVQPLMGNLFKGYNVTILAYGQTGSGKTHTMGTSYTEHGDMGVIPRCVNEIFDFIKENFAYNFNISVTFMELYQEVLYDLLSDKPREQCILEIREDTTKGIHIPNLTEIDVQNVNTVLETLQKGTTRRATSATAMNAHSSRSHAIFSVNISMNHKENCHENKQSKLHLVDLAGSERPKKTGAIGNTFKEGVNINKGLFVLGNVISSLGDEKSQHGFIPYRDSNLTRLLKDSLGGNSITLMIACVSPADYNLEETISTLRYADRAKKIKNKPVVNQDPQAAEINSLKKTIQHLRLQILGQGGPAVCTQEVEAIKKENIDLKTKKRDLSLQLAAALFNNTNLHEKIIILQNANEVLNKKLVGLKDICDITLNSYNIGLETNNHDLLKENLANLEQIKEQFAQINHDQKQTDNEIANHEHNKPSMKDFAVGGHEQSEDIQEKQESHTNRQFNLNIQLTEIEKQLNIKENLAKELISANYVVDYQTMAENEAKIEQLEKEKEELQQMLKNIGNSGKISEQRRKRVQDLEHQLSELKKRVQEQNQKIKMKARDEERIKVLNKEILEMKQTKVKLVKTMREESDKFRQWKIQKERECIKLKQQDIKKQCEIARMKVIHSKQQNVFKRRVEEAEAINRRLKLALSVKQQAQESRNAGKAERIEPWLKQEFDLYVNLLEAEATLKVLLEDRATLQQQLDNMKNNSDADSTDCKSIEDDLELRSVQIQDLQQKLLDSDEDTKAKSRIDKFQTMAEAKYGIKFLFARAAEVVKEKVGLQMKLTELQELYTDTQEKLKSQGEETEQIRQEYEERIRSLLTEINEIKDSLAKQEALQKQIEELELKNDELTEKLEEFVINRTVPPTPALIEKKMNRTFMCNPADSDDAVKIEVSSDAYGTPPNELQNSRDRNLLKPVPVKFHDISLDDFVDEDDVKNDPDWRGTPLGKRIMEEKEIIEKNKKLQKTSLKFPDDSRPSKRSSEGSCTCKKSCKGRCGCFKMGKSCQPTCKCDEQCENREKSENAYLKESDDDVFMKPSNDENELPRKRQKKRLNIFTQNE